MSGETWGRGRWPVRRARQAAVDWAAWTAESAQELLEFGLDEAEARAEAEKRCGRMKLRIEWFSERFDAFLHMQEQAGEACLAQMEDYPEDMDWEAEDAPVLPDTPEDVIAQAIYAEIRAALDEDRWPRHLHFGGI